MVASLERTRHYGEVFTPEWMVDEMLDPISSELPGYSRILDLCAGQGAFIIEIMRRILRSLPLGHGVAEMMREVRKMYAFELYENNVSIVKNALCEVIKEHAEEQGLRLTEGEQKAFSEVLSANIVCTDALEIDEGHLLPVYSESGEKSLEKVAPGFFDFIVSNPPYQKNISGSTENSRLRNHSKATPTYHLFYDWARNLDPKVMAFIIPAKWYTGGWGLDKWRESILDDGQIETLYDYRKSDTIFPGTEVNGGICHVIRRKGYTGHTRVVQFDSGGTQFADEVRPFKLEGANIFVRNPQAASILEKVGSFTLSDDEQFSAIVLSTTPFGIPSNFAEWSSLKQEDDDIQLYYIGKHTHWARRRHATNNVSALDQWKVFLPLSHNQYSDKIIGKTEVFGPGSACSHSYICVGGFETQKQAENVEAYINTKFFRYLASVLKISPIATRKVYRLAPILDWDMKWTDEALYSRYGLTADEQTHIEKSIAAM